MLSEKELAGVWSEALESLGDGTLTPQQKAFVTLTKPLALVGETFLIAAPNEFTKDVLETRLRPLVTTALSEAIGEEVRLAISVDETIAPGLDDATDEIADATYAQTELLENQTFSAARPGGGTPASKQDENSRLNPKYVFDNFVAGSSNKLAHAAAVATWADDGPLAGGGGAGVLAAAEPAVVALFVAGAGVRRGLRGGEIIFPTSGRPRVFRRWRYQ